MREIVRGFTMSIPNVVDGREMALEIEELTPPLVKDTSEQFYGGGMPGPIEVPLGYEISEARFKLASWNPAMLTRIGRAPGQFDRATFRGAAVSEVNGEVTPILIVIEGRIAEVEPDRWSRTARSGLDYRMASIRYYKQVVGTRQIYEIDFLNHKVAVDSVDQRAAINSALGI